MSGIDNVGYCAMTWCDFRNVSSGQVLFFQQIQHDLVKEKQNGSITKGHKRGVLGTTHLVKTQLKISHSKFQNSHSWHNVPVPIDHIR